MRVLGLGLGLIGNGRAWSAVVFALPITLAAAPAIMRYHGRSGFLLLVAGVLVFLVVASSGRRLLGAPIVPSALGSALGYVQ